MANSNVTEVIVVGAGITGIGAGYYLGRRNFSYTILEAADDVGGMWRTQRWHGVRSDSDFIQYCYSFRPYLAPERLQSGGRIQRYVREVAKELGIVQNIRFNTRVLRAVFDPDDKFWHVHTNQGVFVSRFLINGNGYFTYPHVPDFRGMAEFAGEIVHTFQLDAERSFADKDVVLVGSGATAISCAPELARVSRSLTLVQRSPSYIIEFKNRAGPVTLLCQKLYRAGLRSPLAALRYAMQIRDDLVFVGFRTFPRFARWLFRQHWLPVVGKEAVERHFMPRYDPWRQRICVAVGFKNLLKSGAVRIVTGEIDRFEQTMLVMKDGESIKCDVCVLATGFDLDFLKFDLFVGETRISTRAINHYKGIMMGGVPNYFHPVGVWHSAWTRRSEIVTRYAVDIMSYMRARDLKTVSIDRRDVQFTPRLTSNYVLRSLSRMPKLYGVLDLPSIDNLFAYRFRAKEFRFG
jgi:cation diffusion facilitator CzcD-associated flavoprotein CzcO